LILIMRIHVRASLLVSLLFPALLHAQQAPAARLPQPVAPVLSEGAALLPAFVPSIAAGAPARSAAAITTALDTAGAPASTAGLIATGLLAAGASAAAGAAIGYNIDRSSPSPSGGDDPGLGGLIVGWVLAPAVVTPAAVHLIDNQHGSLGASYAAAAVIAGVSLVTAHAGPPAPVAVALVVGAPVLQAASAAIMERRSRRQRH
jgi:hypothetical protein